MSSLPDWWIRALQLADQDVGRLEQGHRFVTTCRSTPRIELEVITAVIIPAGVSTSTSDTTGPSLCATRCREIDYVCLRL